MCVLVRVPEVRGFTRRGSHPFPLFDLLLFFSVTLDPCHGDIVDTQGLLLHDVLGRPGPHPRTPTLGS